MNKPSEPNTGNPHSRSIVRGTGIVSALTLLSRLLGFIRDVLVARLFGAGFIADAFFVAFRIPNLLRSFVAEGALTSAFVPVFADELRAGMPQAQRALSAVGTLLLVITALLALLGIVLAEPVVLLFAPGFTSTPEKLRLCVLLTQIMFPFIIWVSLVSLINGALNSAKIFGAAAWAQVWMNLILILGAVLANFFIDTSAAIILAASVLVGGVIQVVTQIPALHRAGFRLAPTRTLITPVTRRVLWLLLPATLGAAVYQISIFFNTLLASLLPEGSVSWLFYADRLTQLPIGVFTVSLASVILPTLAAAQASGDRESFGRSLVDSLRYTSFVIIPLSLGTFILAEPLIRLMFERGAFSAESTVRTAQAVQTLALGLWGVSCHSMIMRGFIAQKDTRTPTLVSIGTVLFGILLAINFMGPPVVAHSAGMTSIILQIQDVLHRGGFTLALGHAGLGLASSVAATGGFAILLFILRRRNVSIEWSPFVVTTAKTFLASGAMGVALIAAGIAQLPSPAAIGLGTLIGGATYLLAAALLRMQEFEEGLLLLQKLARRLRQPRG
jgi:putative peptidoglycan lipid II flippase